MKKILLGLLFFAQPALRADETLLECRQIETVAERVACYDDFVDSHLPTDSIQADVVPDARSLFGTSDADAKLLVETSLDIEQISEIEAIVTDVQKTATRKFIVSLDNGQTWRQLDGQRLSIMSGDAVIVRKASLGSYLLEKQSGSRSIRVTRLN